jgi:hypothetical protein
MATCASLCICCIAEEDYDFSHQLGHTKKLLSIDPVALFSKKRFWHWIEMKAANSWS